MKLGGRTYDSSGRKADFAIYEVDSVRYEYGYENSFLICSIGTDKEICIHPIDYKDAEDAIEAFKTGDYYELDSKYEISLRDVVKRAPKVVAEIVQDVPLEVAISAVGNENVGYTSVRDSVPVEIITD